MVTGWVKMKIFFWKYYFKHATFLYLPRLSSGLSSGHHQSFFVISYFLAESLKANKNQQKRPHTLQYSFSKKTSLILQTSTHLTLKIICSLNKTKNLSDFTNFPANIFLIGVRKNICTAPFLDAEEPHSWSTLKANVCISLYISWYRSYNFSF